MLGLASTARCEVGLGGAFERYERGLEELERIEQKTNLAKLNAMESTVYKSSVALTEDVVGLGGAFQNFERGLEEVERTEQKHHLAQVKIMRDQIGVFTTTISAMQAKLADVEGSLYRGLGQVQTEITDTNEKLRVDLTRQDTFTASEVKVALEARLADLEKRVQNEVEERILLGRQVGEEVACAAMSRRSIEADVRALKEQFPVLAEADQVFKEKLETVMQFMEREVPARKFADDGLLSKIGDIQQQMKAADALNMQRIIDLESELVKQSTDRSDVMSSTRRLVDGVATTVLELRNELQANQKVCRDQFGSLEPKLDDQQKRLDRISGERVMQGVRLEQKLTELAGRVEEGFAERSLMKRENEEGLTTMRQKLLDVICEQNRELHSKLQTFEAWMQKAMTSEEAVRGSELRKIEAKLWADNRSTEEQLVEIRSRLDVYSEMCRDMVPMSELQGSLSRMQELERQFRGLFVALEDLRLGTEKEFGLLDKKQADLLDETLQDISLRFKDNLAHREKGKTVPIALPSTPFGALSLLNKEASLLTEEIALRNKEASLLSLRNKEASLRTEEIALRNREASLLSAAERLALRNTEASLLSVTEGISSMY